MGAHEAFGTRYPVIGVLHLPPLPGSPANELDLDGIADHAMRDAGALSAGGVDGLIVENFGDAPFYPNRVPRHTVAQMSVLGRAIRDRHPDLPLGVNVLRNDGLSALAIASATKAEFIRVNVYCGARVTDQGLIEGEAHEIQRYRATLDESLLVFADVDVKHSSPLGDGDLESDAHDVVSRGRADAVIVSGTGTGAATGAHDLERARTAVGDAVPVWVGSGVTPDNVTAVLAYADGLIVGSAFKYDGDVTNAVDPDRVAALISAVRDARNREG